MSKNVGYTYGFAKNFKNLQKYLIVLEKQGLQILLSAGIWLQNQEWITMKHNTGLQKDRDHGTAGPKEFLGKSVQS